MSLDRPEARQAAAPLHSPSDAVCDCGRVSQPGRAGFGVCAWSIRRLEMKRTVKQGSMPGASDAGSVAAVGVWCPADIWDSVPNELWAESAAAAAAAEWARRVQPAADPAASDRAAATPPLTSASTDTMPDLSNTASAAAAAAAAARRQRWCRPQPLGWVVTATAAALACVGIWRRGLGRRLLRRAVAAWRARSQDSRRLLPAIAAP